MCGGIIANLSQISKRELNKFYSEKEIEKMEKAGRFETYYWSKRPVLPVREQQKITLYDWGNRDKDLALPKTGWAKKESLDQGKWNWLTPKKVCIPALRGYEKGVWFDFKRGVDGVLVEKNHQARVYMVTQKADSNYQRLTKHERMPVGEKSNFQDKNFQLIE